MSVKAPRKEEFCTRLQRFPKNLNDHNCSWSVDFIYMASWKYPRLWKKKEKYYLLLSYIFKQTNKKLLYRRTVMPGTDIFLLLHLSQQCTLSLVTVILSIVRLGFH